MTIDRAAMAFAGLVILASLGLAQLQSPMWLLLTAFVGLNLIQASFTGFCPAAMIFKRLGIKAGTAFRVRSGDAGSTAEAAPRRVRLKGCATARASPDTKAS